MTTAWPEVALGEVVRQKDQKIAKPEGLAVASITRGRGLIPQDQVFKKQIASRDVSKYKVVSYGDVVVGIHIDEGAIGTSLLHDDHLVSPAYSVWSVKDQEKVDSNYLGKFLRSPLAIRYFIANYRKTADRRGKLTQESLLALKIPLPPLDEQRRIAAILDKADEIRAKRKAALETLEKLSQAIFIEMFGDPVANPKRWPQVEISSLVNSVETWNPKSDLGREFTYIDVSSVDRYSKTVTGATSLECSSAPSRAKQLVRDGDVLVSTVRPNLNGVALITSELNGATASTGFTVLRPKQGVLASQYLFEWVKSPVFIERLMRQATGSSYPAVSDRIIKSETLLLPSIDAQLEFTSRMTHVSKFAMTARLQAMAAENLYSSIQQRAFQGTL